MISFIVNTYNRESVLIENLHNMKVLGKSVEIVVVDDHSTENTEAQMKDFIKNNTDIRIKYIRNESNQGYAKSMNIGIESSSSDFVFILNDDVFINNPTSFVKIVEDRIRIGNIVTTRLETECKLSQIQQAKTLLYSIPAQIFAGEIYNYNNLKTRYVKYGNNALGFDKKALKLLFDDRNFAGNFFRIESDFQCRARLLGFKIFYDPRLLILHKDVSIGGLRQGSKNRFLYWCIYNHIIFLRKNSGPAKYHKIMFYFLLKSVSHPVRIKTVFIAFSNAFKAKIKN